MGREVNLGNDQGCHRRHREGQAADEGVMGGDGLMGGDGRMGAECYLNNVDRGKIEGGSRADRKRTKVSEQRLLAHRARGLGAAAGSESGVICGRKGRATK